MFRKLVSNLSFSPALITQVSFYANRLRKEEVTRRLTVVFAVLALVVQSLAVFTPPESANASSEQDLIRGGVQNIDDFITLYDKNSDDIKDIYTTVGVTRSEIESAVPASINSKDNLYGVTRYAQHGSEDGEVAFQYNRSAGGKGQRYISPLQLNDVAPTAAKDGTSYQAFVGMSVKAGWFAIVKSSASLVTKGQPVTIVPIKSLSSIQQKIDVVNTSRTTSPAQSFDTLRYTITNQNTSTKPATSTFEVTLDDVLEYASIVDAGGGSYNSSTKKLTWSPSVLPANTTDQRIFVVQISSSIAATSAGIGNAKSYDCTLSASYGSSVDVPVECPPVKGLESLLTQLPTAGIIINSVFAISFIAVISFFYIRTKQLKDEIRLVRHNINTGTL